MIAILLTAALRTLITGALAGGAFRLLRVHHPVFRKAVWACVLLTGFAMPFLQTHSLIIRLPLFQDQASSLVLPNAVSNELQALSTGSSTKDERVAGVTEHRWYLHRHLPALASLALSFYLLVAGVLLLRIAFGLLTALRVLRKSVPLRTSSNRSVRLSQEIETPWTFGSFILLPAQAAAWDDEQLRLVLAHEASHVRQFDFYLQLAARIYAVAFWFSPLGWWLERECERLGEQTSDRAALSIADSSYTYADLLLRFSTDSTLPAVCMARRSGVRARVETILTHGSVNRLFERPRRAAFSAFFVVVLSVVAGNLELSGQTAGEQDELAKPTVPFQTFDVISVKPSKATNGRVSMHFDGTSLNANNMDVTMLLMNAYGIRPGLVSGVPKWAEKDRYDIAAKITEPNPAFKDRKLPRRESEAIWHANVQTILSEKFRLKVHYETVTAPVYNLVLINGGPKFPVSQAPENQEMMNVNNNALEATHIPMKAFCANLASTVERSIIDKTGLTGDYDMKLTWTPEEQVNTAKDSGIANPPPDIYTALQEQLGLKLVPAKGPVRKLVVDSIEPPAAN